MSPGLFYHQIGEITTTIYNNSLHLKRKYLSFHLKTLKSYLYLNNHKHLARPKFIKRIKKKKYTQKRGQASYVNMY